MANEKQGWSSSAIGNPESLKKMAELVSPESTPLLTAFKAGSKVTNTTHSWLTRSLDTAASNAVAEGATITPADPEVYTRLYNYTQLSHKTKYLTDTQQAIAKANGNNLDIGTVSEDALKALKRDMEYGITTNASASAHVGSTAAGTAGGVAYWTTTAAGSAYRVSATASGTTTLDEALHFIPMMQGIYTQHEPENMAVLLSVGNKTRFDQFTGGAVKQIDPKTGQLVNDVKGYRSSFGNFATIVSRYMPNTDVYGLDMNFWAKSFLQPYEDFVVIDKNTKTAHKIAIGWQAEWTVECWNPGANGRIFGLDA